MGFSDTLLLDPVENELVPYRQFTFRLQPARAASAPEWVTLRKSLVEILATQIALSDDV